jgi:uncharacterized protein
VRMKEHYDGAEPSGNSVALSNLVRLARHLDRPEWETMARKTLEAFASTLSQQPSVMPNMVAAALVLEASPRQIVFASGRNDALLHALQREVFSRYVPDLTIIYNLLEESADDSGMSPSRVRGMVPIDGRPTAYLCEEYVCRAPVTEPADLRQQLG